MEAASIPIGITVGLSSRRARRRARRVARLLSDADRFERAARRLEEKLGSVKAWQVDHLRRAARELRELAVREETA